MEKGKASGLGAVGDRGGLSGINETWGFGRRSFDRDSAEKHGGDGGSPPSRRKCPRRDRALMVATLSTAAVRLFWAALLRGGFFAEAAHALLQLFAQRGWGI